MRLLLPIGVILFSLVAFSAPGKRTVLNGLAATVGKQTITLQDAYLYRSLQRFREGETSPILIEQGDDLKRTVQKIVFEEMVFQEMKSLEIESGPRTDAEKLVQEKRKKKGGEAAWKEISRRFSLSDSVLIDHVNKILQVEKFLQKKVDTLTPVITEGEIERYYKQNEARFRGSSLDQLKPSISLLLKKQYAQKGLEDWVRFLKEKYRVQNQLDG